MRAASLIQVGATGILGAFESVHMKNQGLSEAQIGLIMAMESGLMMITALLWGRVADHTRRFKVCLAIATVGMVFVFGWFARAEDFGDFVVYGLLRGIFFTGIMGLMPALALANLDPLRPGSGFGGYRRFGSIGFIWAASIMPLLFAGISTMALVAMAYLPISLYFVWALRDPTGSTAADGEPEAPLNKPALGVFLIAHFLACMSEPGIHGFFNTYARELGASMEWVGILSGMTGVIALLSLGYMGRLADRVGAARILVLGFAAQMLRMLVTSFISDPNWLWVAHLFHGFGWAGREVGTLLFMTALMGKPRLGMATSLMMSVRMAGMMAGALTMGWLAEVQGYPLMFRVIAGCVTVGLFALGLAIRARRTKTQPTAG